MSSAQEAQIALALKAAQKAAQQAQASAAAAKATVVTLNAIAANALFWQGTWDTNRGYSKYAVVLAADVLYSSLQDGNKGHAPASSPSFWQPFGVPPSLVTETPTANKVPLADGSGKLDPGWLPAAGGVQTIEAGANINVDATDPAHPVVSATSGGVPPLVTVYTVFGLSEAGPFSCPGVKVGDRICGGFAYDGTQSGFPISVNRGILNSGHGNYVFGGDVIERTVTVANEIQQVDNEDWSAATFVIFTQSMS